MAILALCTLVWSCNGTVRFDARKWQVTDCLEDSYVADTYREYVVDDLVDKILPGMHRGEVTKLLGPPDSSDSTLTYCLGPRSPLRQEFTWLRISFTREGIFDRATIIDE